MTSTRQAAAVAEPSAEPGAQAPPAPPEHPTRRFPDRVMRKLLRVDGVGPRAGLERSAHGYLRASMVITGIRCLVTYLLIPIAVPIIGLSGAVSAPIGLALSLIAIVSGVVSLRRFWQSDHRLRWMYSAFILCVFAVLAIGMYADISEIAGSA